MEKKVTKVEGWQIICKNAVFIENGKVIRGYQCGLPVYPYRWDKKLNCWCKVTNLSAAAFRAACNRNSIKMM